MHNPFAPGDRKIYRRTVTQADAAAFESGQVHPFYSTFALARDAEWACRLFVLEMKEDHEEGIGTFLSVHHVSPAAVGEEVTITAVIEAVHGHRVLCRYEVRVGRRLVAYGRQEQRIIPREKVKAMTRKLQTADG